VINCKEKSRLMNSLPGNFDFVTNKKLNMSPTNTRRKISLR
jgi:hypothetical protein